MDWFFYELSSKNDYEGERLRREPSRFHTFVQNNFMCSSWNELFEQLIAKHGIYVKDFFTYFIKSSVYQKLTELDMKIYDLQELLSTSPSVFRKLEIKKKIDIGWAIQVWIYESIKASFLNNPQNRHRVKEPAINFFPLF